MHGEYKVPGGKLVVADLDIVDNRLARVELSGDFFLEPDTALDAMTAALEGVSADATEEELVALVRQAAAGAELIGLTPAGIAIAVRRAIEGGTR